LRFDPRNEGLVGTVVHKLIVAFGLLYAGGVEAEEKISDAALRLGYSVVTWRSEPPYSPSSVDIDGRNAPGAFGNFKWRLANYFGSSTPRSSVAFNNDGSMAILNEGDVSAEEIGTIARIKRPPFFVGTAFGCGAYIEAEISFDPAAVAKNPNNFPYRGWPAFWAMAAEHLWSLSSWDDQQWQGQAPGFSNFIEADIFEYVRIQSKYPFTYASTLHEWYGKYASNGSGTCGQNRWCVVDSPFDATFVGSTINWKEWHKAAMLWVPATPTEQGFVQFYFDGVPGRKVSWRRYKPSTPPPPSTADGSAFSVMDAQHLALIIGSGSGAINVRNVRVIQNPRTACNITN
jgi:hypothetical protein